MTWRTVVKEEVHQLPQSVSGLSTQLIDPITCMKLLLKIEWIVLRDFCRAIRGVGQDMCRPARFDLVFVVPARCDTYSSTLQSNTLLSKATFEFLRLLTRPVEYQLVSYTPEMFANSSVLHVFQSSINTGPCTISHNTRSAGPQSTNDTLYSKHLRGAPVPLIQTLAPPFSPCNSRWPAFEGWAIAARDTPLAAFSMLTTLSPLIACHQTSSQDLRAS